MHFISTLLVDIKLLLLILIHLVDIWYDDKYLYKVVISTIQTPANDLKVKVKDLEFSRLKILSEGSSSFDPLRKNIVSIIGNLYYLLILIV